MFKNYDILSVAVNDQFKDFQIEMSKLPDKITFDNKNENLPIQIKISSKDQAKPGAPQPPVAPQGGTQ